MGFERVWDSSCPRVWDSWQADSVNWVIRDLRPEDDEEAVKILCENLCPDEVLCAYSGIVNDPVSLQAIKDFWIYYIGKRFSLGCYEEKDDQSKLVAVNVCLVICEGEESHDNPEGKAWYNVYKGLEVVSDKVDVFKLLNTDKMLYAYGLVVHRDYRGRKIASKILAAREPLARHHGVKGTSTVFTGPAAQKSAERAGFSTAVSMTLKDLSDAGLDYPKDDNWHVKLMVKKYDDKTS